MFIASLNVIRAVLELGTNCLGGLKRPGSWDWLPQPLSDISVHQTHTWGILILITPSPLPWKWRGVLCLTTAPTHHHISGTTGPSGQRPHVIGFASAPRTEANGTSFSSFRNCRTSRFNMSYTGVLSPLSWTVTHMKLRIVWMLCGLADLDPEM